MCKINKNSSKGKLNYCEVKGAGERVYKSKRLRPGGRNLFEYGNYKYNRD